MIADALLERLVCPACKGTPLRLEIDEVADDQVASGSLGCPDCKRWYRVTDDMPALMPSEVSANLRAVGSRWEPWRDAMEQFLYWRQTVWGDPEEAARRAENARGMHERFIAFCGLPAEQSHCLDIGCGSGHLADMIGEQCEYVGIDPLPGGRMPGGSLPAHMPRPTRPVSLVQGVGELLPFIDDCFGVATITGTLDHCRDPEQVLAEARRVLTPGGVLGLLQGIARDGSGIGGSLRTLALRLKGGSSPDVAGTHVHKFSAEVLRGLLAEHFEIEGELEDESGRLFIRAMAPRGAA